MKLNEALAVYEYLKNRAPGNRSQDEDRALAQAWKVVCECAVAVIKQNS